MSQGRRRRRLRWYSGGVAVAALTATAVAGTPLAVTALQRPRTAPVPAVVASPAMTAAGLPGASIAPAAPAGLTGCTVQRLPTEGVDKAVVTGGDPSGRYVAGRTYPQGGGEYPVLIWRDGRIAATVAMPGGDQLLEDINTQGTAVGSSYAPDLRAFVYRDGRLAPLAGGTPIKAVAVNDAGVIVGSAVREQRSRPVRWSSATADPVELPLPAGVDEGETVDIDEDGTVLGSIEVGAAEPTGYLWLPDGTGRRLPRPAVGGERLSYFRPVALRNGWVVGHAAGAARDGKRYDFRYSISTDRYEQLPGDSGGGYRMRVSEQGWVLREPDRLTILTGRGQITLPSYRGLKGRPYFQMAAFSDDGRTVAGHGYTDATENQPLLWRCR
jgi:hypothetical protein